MMSLPHRAECSYQVQFDNLARWVSARYGDASSVRGIGSGTKFSGARKPPYIRNAGVLAQATRFHGGILLDCRKGWHRIRKNFANFDRFVDRRG
jgi:hypothetical protein